MKILLTILFFAFTIPCSAQYNSDSLWNTWKNPAAADTARLEALSLIIQQDYLHSFPDSAFILAQQQYDFAVKKNQKKQAAQALHMMGRVRGIKGDYIQALNYYTASLDIREAIHDTLGITACLNNIGVIYADQGNMTKAIEYFFHCLKIREATGDKKGQTSSMGNIADAYIREGNFTKALDYFKRSLAIAEEMNNKRLIGIFLAGVGMAYKELEDTVQAANHYKRAIAIQLKSEDKEQLARTYYSMSSLLELEGKYNEAISYQQMSLGLRTQLGDSIGMMKSLYVIGLLYETKKQFNEAIIYGEKALAIARTHNLPRTNRNIGELLSRLYERKGDYKNALKMYRFYVAARDSMHNDELKNVNFKEQLKYDFEKKELLAKAAHETTLNRLQLAAERSDMKKNTWLISTIGVSLLLAFAGIFFIYSFKQKNIIATQKANLLRQKLLVSQLNPHFIFNSLGAVQNAIMKQDALQAGNYLAQFSHLMRCVLDFSRKEYITVEAECDFLVNYLELQQLRLNHKFDYTLVIDERIDRERTMIPPMLAQPFVENAIEHGIFYKKEKGTITLRMLEENGRLFYEIEDDGVGLAEAGLRKKNTAQPHDSLATLITKERLYTHIKKSKTRSEKLQITDKLPAAPGVKVRFEIPFLHN